MKNDLAKIEFYNKTSKNKLLAVSFAGSRYFCKFLSKGEFEREIAGYNFIKKYYPVSNLVGKLQDKNNNLLIFEYEKTITKNEGLLVDLFATKKKLLTLA